MTQTVVLGFLLKTTVAKFNAFANITKTCNLKDSAQLYNELDRHNLGANSFLAVKWLQQT